MTPNAEANFRRLLAASLTRPLSSSEQAELDAWAATSAAAREEIARTREVWLALGVAAEDPAIRTLRRQARRQARLDGARSQTGHAPRVMVVGSLALSVAAALLVGVALKPGTKVETYSARPYAATRVALPDGSHVVLSPGGRLTARFTRGARDVALDRGDGFFEVAHDAARPFAVAASGRTLTVLGTRFNVAGGQGLTVSLVQGSLRVSQPGAASIVLKPGQRYVAGPKSGGEVQAGDVASDAAWTNGRVVLSNANLATAAERLSRASGRRIELTDLRLTKLRLSGSLTTQNMEDVGIALETLLPVRAHTTAQGDLVISPRGNPS